MASSALKAKQAIGAINSGATTLSGGGSTTQETSAPSFNLVQGTPTNQISESISGLNDKPVTAIVVASDVSTAQQANRNKVSESSI